MSTYTRPITASLMTSGLVGSLYYQVTDNAGNVLVARTNNGVAEKGTSADYFAYVPNWDSAWRGILTWDVDGNDVAIEDFQPDVGIDLLTLIRGPEDTASPFGPGTFSLTSYVSIEGANAYFSTRLNTEAWDEANYEQQFKALATASRAVDRLNFVGVKSEITQKAQWPRIIRGVVQTPEDILIAVCEIAASLLDGVDPDLEDELLGSASDAYATVRTTSDPKVARDHVKAGIPSIEAWRYLLPWLQDARSIHLRKG